MFLIELDYEIISYTHIGNINPIRYRGYHYDDEIGFYYLQSRYYDLDIKRFINADDSEYISEDILGTNLYAYCENNPIMNSDPSGHKMNTIKNLLNCTVSLVVMIGELIGSKAYWSVAAKIITAYSVTYGIFDFLKIIKIYGNPKSIEYKGAVLALCLCFLVNVVFLMMGNIKKVTGLVKPMLEFLG